MCYQELLAGLAAAVEFLESRGIDAIHAHHTELAEQLLRGLQALSGVTIHGPTGTADRTSVVSFTHSGYDSQELAAVLETSGAVQCRAGLHCAPHMHAALGTLEQGGTVRLSPGWATTPAEIERTLETVSAVMALSRSTNCPKQSVESG